MKIYLIFLCLLSMCSLCFSAECNSELSVNLDYPGSDIQHLYSPDVEHCQHLCTQHPNCQFFTFVRPDWTRDKRHFYCYLKATPSGVPNRQESLLGVTSGYSLRPCSSAPLSCLSKVYENTDFFGADYKTFFTADYESCQKACTRDPACQFFTFVNDVFTPENIRFKCHLKFSWTIPRTPIVEATAGLVSGFSHKTQMGQKFDTACQGKFFTNTAIPGNHLLALPAASAEYCQALCSAHPSCTYFAFVSNKLNCNLKNNPDTMVMTATAGTTSGLPERLCQLNDSWLKTAHEDIDFKGSDIRFELMDDAETCQRTCTEDVNCQFYTYVYQTFHDSDFWRRCYLKRVITMPSPPKITKLNNVVSGFHLRNCDGALSSSAAV